MWPRILALVVLIGIAGTAVTALLVAGSSSTKKARLPSACQTAREQFVVMENETVKSADSSANAIGHWDDLWNQWVSGKMTNAQQQAALQELRADATRNGDSFKKTGDAARATQTALKDCTAMPKGCLAEFQQYPTIIAHEGRETNAIGQMYATALAQNNAWNAQVHGVGSVAAVNAATAAHTAAKKAYLAAVDEHNRLLAVFKVNQAACNKAA